MTIVNNPAVDLRPAESRRVARTHMPERAGVLGATVRELDRSLRLDGGGNGLLDTTHFDTVRFPPPAWAADVIAEAIADGSAAYTPYRGAPAVLDDLAPRIASFLDAPVGVPNIALTPGTQAGLFTTLSAIVDEGDLVLLADPEYLFMERMLAFLGARVERIAIDLDGDVATPDLDRVEALLDEQPVLFVYSHPNNPTGAVYPTSSLERLAELAQRGGFRILADELYSRLLHPGAEYRHMASFSGMLERTITMLGPSKTESLSGFRLGVVVGPEDVMAAIEQTLALTSLRAPAYAQRLLTHWLVDDVDLVATRIEELGVLRDMTVAALGAVPGVRVVPRLGTAYLFVDVRALDVPDAEVARALQQGAGVIVSPGYQFGPTGVGHFRVCYARDETEWAAALERMAAVLSGLGTNGTSASDGREAR